MLTPSDKLRIDDENHCAAIRSELAELSPEIFRLTSDVSSLEKRIQQKAEEKLAERDLANRRQLENELVRLRVDKKLLEAELNANNNRLETLWNDARRHKCGF